MNLLLKNSCVLSLIVAVCGIALDGLAEEKNTACVASDQNCRQVGSWELGFTLGAGGRTNPLVGGEDQAIILLPQVSWYGKRFFLENFEIGFTLVDESAHMLNLIVEPGFEQVFFDDFGFGNFTLGGGSLGLGSSLGSPESNYLTYDASLEGVQDSLVDLSPGRPAAEESVFKVDVADIDEREQAFLGGLEYSFYRGNWQTQLQALTDVSGIHEGEELRLSVGYQGRVNKNLYAFSLGFAWQSDALLDYYYGLEEGELTGTTISYEADAGVSGLVKFSWERKLSKKWYLLSAIQYRSLDSSLKSSPLVEDTGVVTAFIGGGYHF